MTDPVFSGDGFHIERRVLGALDTNVLLVVDVATNRSLVVDAAYDGPAIIDMAAGTDVIAVVATHGHWDHVQAVPQVTSEFGVPFLLHSKDAVDFSQQIIDTLNAKAPASPPAE